MQDFGPFRTLRVVKFCRSPIIPMWQSGQSGCVALMMCVRSYLRMAALVVAATALMLSMVGHASACSEPGRGQLLRHPGPIGVPL